MHALAKPHFYHPNPTASDSTPPKNTQSHDSSSKILESCANSKNQKSFREEVESNAQSKPLSSTILESKSVNENHKTRRSRSFFSKSHRERLKLESTFEKSHDSKSNAHSLSSRASETSVAIHKGTQADSRKAHNAESLESTFSKVDSRVDCHADFQSARNDRKNAYTSKSTARNDRENNATNKKVDSSLNAHSPSLRDTAPAAAWQSISTKNAKADSKQNAQKSQKVDSSSAQNLHDQADTPLSKKAGKKPVLRFFATTLLRFFHFAGVNAIYFYIAQGISSSLLSPYCATFRRLYGG